MRRCHAAYTRSIDGMGGGPGGTDDVGEGGNVGGWPAPDSDAPKEGSPEGGGPLGLSLIGPLPCFGALRILGSRPNPRAAPNPGPLAQDEVAAAVAYRENRVGSRSISVVVAMGGAPGVRARTGAHSQRLGPTGAALAPTARDRARRGPLSRESPSFPLVIPRLDRRRL